MHKLFDDGEDRAFSRTVLRYNSMAEGSLEKLELENKVRERTKLLLYLIPQRNLFLRQEDASAFFMDIIRDIDRIIDSFRVSRLTFNGYLTQICRYRCLRYMSRKRKRERAEDAIICSDTTDIYGTSVFDSIADEEEPAYECEALPSPDPEVESLGMTGVISRIIDERIETPALTEAEEALQGALLDKVSRRRFLTLLLTLPDTETPGFISGVARVMSVDRGLIHRFYTLRHDELEVSYEERVKAEDVAGRYWKALMLLRHAIAKETDMEKIEDLEKAYRRTKGIFTNRKGPHDLAEKVVKELEVNTPGVSTPVRRLSGGNVQKVLVGREIAAAPTVLLTAYAVRGLDINASYMIYDLINKQKERGVAVIYVGEDLDVLLELCDRILVLCGGKVSGLMEGRGATKRKVGMMMTRLGGAKEDE